MSESNVSKPPHLEGSRLVVLSTSISLYYPSSSSTNNTTKNAPDLIILLPWLSAPPRPIAKYLTGYQRLYPNTPILLFQTPLSDMIWRSNMLQHLRLQPGIEATLAHTQHTSNPQILMHLFSNGGAHQACQFATAYLQATGTPLPIRAMILDSSPGRGTYQRSLEAMTLSLPSRNLIIRWLGMTMVHLTLVVAWVMRHVLGMEDMIEKIRKGLNDRSLFRLEARRCYLYSTADRLVEWEDVEGHCREAAELGYTVDRVRFDRSKHAAHVLEDESRYWGAVKGVWEAGGFVEYTQ